MSAEAKILDRLQRVRATSSNTWLASCPTGAHKHGDRSRGLSIRVTDDRVLLLHCFAGCEPGDVLAAIGLGMSDLFPERLPEHRYSASHTGIPPRDLLVVLDHEITVATLILNDIVSRRSVSESQVHRLCQAAARIGKARDMANPAKAVPHAA
jgi:hypothetical protein